LTIGVFAFLMIMLTLTFTRPEGTSCRLEARSAVEDWSGRFASPFPADTVYAVTRALEPTFDLSAVTEAIIAALDAADLVPGDTLAVEVGDRLGEALCVTPVIGMALHTALTTGQERGELLDIRLIFGEDCGWAAALPWEVLRLQGCFLVSGHLATLTRMSPEADRDQLIKMHERSLDASERAGDTRAAAESSMRLGYLYRQTGKWERAIEVCRRGLEAYDHLGDARGVAQIKMYLGSVYLQKGEWERAIELYEQSLEMNRRVGAVDGLAQVYNNLGGAHLQKGDCERAVEMYQQSLAIKEQLGDVQGMARSWNGLGLVYATTGELDRAATMYRRSLEAFSRLGDAHGLAQPYNNLGLLYSDAGKRERAVQIYRKSLEIFERLGDTHGMTQSWVNLGNAYRQSGEWRLPMPILSGWCRRARELFLSGPRDQQDTPAGNSRRDAFVATR